MSTEREKAIEKIRKLLRLSKSSNEHEAAAALRQAQKMMVAAGLDIDDVSDDLSVEWRTPYQGEELSRELHYIISSVNTVFSTVATLGSYRTGGKWATNCQKVTFYGRGASAKLALYGAQCMLRQMNSDRALFLAARYPFALTAQKRAAARGFNLVWLDSAWANLRDIVPNQEARAAAEARRDQGGPLGPAMGSKKKAVAVTPAAFHAAQAMGSAFKLSVPLEAETPDAPRLNHE